MNAHDAHMALAPLVAGTPGWNDEAVKFYTSELTRLSDPDLLAQACKDVLWAWRLGRRPSIADIAECYNGRLSKALIAEDPRLCSSCDGTGWIEALDFHAPYCRKPDTCNCHAVDRCPSCSSGDPGPAGRPQLEAPTMSLIEYLDLLAQRAAAGNRAAAKELANWRKHRESPYLKAFL